MAEMLKPRMSIISFVILIINNAVRIADLYALDAARANALCVRVAVRPVLSSQ